MKKIRGIWLILLGVVLAFPCFIWLQVSAGTIPRWFFYTSLIVFGFCTIIGLFQITLKKDVILDDDIMRDMK